MTALVETETESEESDESTGSTRKMGFFARRRKRKERERRERELAGRLEKLESEQEGLKSTLLRRQADRSVREGTAYASGVAGARRKKSATQGRTAPRRIDSEARRELAAIQDRRDFLKKSAIGAGILAMGAGLGYGSGYAQATGLSGNTRTVITENEIAARVIGGVRIATEFIPDPVPAGTDADPYPGSAIQAALDDGLHVYVPSGTWKLSATISRPVDGATVVGAGKSTKLILNGATPCISAGTQSGWLIANMATDAGGVDISSAVESRITEIWVDGVLTDNRPIGSGGGGGGGYYGVRAEDYITQGDGSASNPYNASAIQSAINALPARGGIVFIKAGVWGRTGESRITVGSNKRVLIYGEGCEESIYGKDANQIAQTGTHVRAGFDCYMPTDFQNLMISPRVGQETAEAGIKMIVDSTQISDTNRWTGGFRIQDVHFQRCHPGIHLTGQNIDTGAGDTQQMWQVRIERVSMVNGGTALKIDNGGVVNGTANFRGDIVQLFSQHNSSVSARNIDINIDTSKGEWSHWLIEDSSKAGVDYTMYISTYGTGGVSLHDIDFGDGNNATQDAYLRIGSNGKVWNFKHGKGVTIDSRGWYQIGRRTGGTGTVNIVNGQNLHVEEIPGGDGLVLGAVSLTDPSTVNIVKYSGDGYLGTTTPGGSPYTYTNNDYRVEYVYLVGGSISDVSRAGQSLGVERSHFMRPGDSIVITYSSAPAIKRYGVSTI